MIQYNRETYEQGRQNLLVIICHNYLSHRPTLHTTVAEAGEAGVWGKATTFRYVADLIEQGLVTKPASRYGGLFPTPRGLRVAAEKSAKVLTLLQSTTAYYTIIVKETKCLTK